VPGSFNAFCSACEGSIFFPAFFATFDRVKALSLKTSRPTVLRSERKIRKSELVRSSDPTVWRLWYAIPASALIFAPGL
jgi:hypothetical protein